MRAAVKAPSKLGFYVTLGIVSLLMGLGAVLILSTEPNVVEIRAPVSWMRLSRISLASAPGIGEAQSVKQEPAGVPTNIAVGVELLPYVAEVRVDDRQIWQPTKQESGLSSLAIGKLPGGTFCDEFSVYVSPGAPDSMAAKAKGVEVTFVADRSDPSRRMDSSCSLDLTWSSTGHEALKAGSQLSISLRHLDRNLPLLRYIAGKGLETEFSDAAPGAHDSRPFSGRRVSFSATQVVIDRLGILARSGSARSPALDLDAHVSNPDDVNAVSGPYRMPILHRWGTRLIAPIMTAIATALSLFLSVLHAGNELASARAKAPSSFRGWKAARIVLVVCMVVFPLGILGWLIIGVSW